MKLLGCRLSVRLEEDECIGRGQGKGDEKMMLASSVEVSVDGCTLEDGREMAHNYHLLCQVLSLYWII